MLACDVSPTTIQKKKLISAEWPTSRLWWACTVKYSCFFIRNKQQFRNVLPHFLQYLDVRVRSHTQVWHKKTVFWERVSETIEFIDKELSLILCCDYDVWPSAGSGHVTEQLKLFIFRSFLFSMFHTLNKQWPYVLRDLAHYIDLSTRFEKSTFSVNFSDGLMRCFAFVRLGNS